MSQVEQPTCNCPNRPPAKRCVYNNKNSTQYGNRVWRCGKGVCDFIQWVTPETKPVQKSTVQPSPKRPPAKVSTPLPSKNERGEVIYNVTNVTVAKSQVKTRPVPPPRPPVKKEVEIPISQDPEDDIFRMIDEDAILKARKLEKPNTPSTAAVPPVNETSTSKNKNLKIVRVTSKPTSAPPIPSPELCVKCDCGEITTEKTVKKDGENKGKKFYCCYRGRGDPDECGFFMWKDKLLNVQPDPEPPRSRVVASHNDILRKNTLFKFVEEGGKLFQLPDKDGTAPPRGEPKPNVEYTRKQHLIELFKEMSQREGFRFRYSTGYATEFSYVDGRITRGEYDKEDWTFNAQTPAKMHHSDLNYNYDVIWVQIHGINTITGQFEEEDEGFVISGTAQIIVFELESSLLIVNRKPLWKYINTMVEKVVVHNPYEADHKWLKMTQHSSLNEIRTLLPIETLKKYHQEHPEEQLLFDVWPIPQDLLKAYDTAIGRVPVQDSTEREEPELKRQKREEENLPELEEMPEE